ncbi:helix-turn-helix domain-containing protein [Leifsonia sp. AG29]|uniref:helix-turn-helix domain-containing protein n=1 Tax=Leifsonia sp. AG29 TaxID=2598860 RepID=UPI00131E5BC2|nr:helix-turn-helix transcriptional regulator [Leifsonia sp. AG29]
MLVRHALGTVLRRIRTERGTTLRQLSERSSVSIPYLSEIERGRKEASSEIVAALCRELDVSERDLLTAVAAEFAGAPVISLLPTGAETADAAAASSADAAAPVVALAA